MRNSPLPDGRFPHARSLLAGVADGPVVATAEPLSFWGGVDPATGRVIDIRHPLHGVSLGGAILLMPTSRGSCSGSGVLLELALTGRAPAALVFCEAEDVLTLGALVASEMFGRSLPVLRLDAEAFQALSQAKALRIDETLISGDGVSLPVAPPEASALELTAGDRAMRDGVEGLAVSQAMRILCAMAAQQGARALVDVSRVHIDGCIYASPANLTFAERMVELGAKVRVPTTTNAISVEPRWRAQGVPESFGAPAARLADAYVRMGCQPTFTCAPYLLNDAPKAGEILGWAESNAVVFANSALGARTAKHPDFLDLCIALTGRAPLAGVYLDAHRTARRIIDVERPAGADESFWPLLGYLAGRASADRIPMLRVSGRAPPSRDDLKALCAAFGTTSAAPMLHIDGVTPEADHAMAHDADRVALTRADMAAAWAKFNDGPAEVQLVAIGSPHASLDECRALADALGGRQPSPEVAVIVTAGKDVIAAARREGLCERLEASGVVVLTDLCWCTICEPVFPTQVRTVMTNSCKYAHYGPGLHGRVVRFGSLSDCVAAALTGRAPMAAPSWLS
jgi:predicted aconitase/predicted aconitase with swiveling domain